MSLSSSSTVAYVALGANLGNPTNTIKAAIGELATLPGTRLLAASSLYRTAPVGLKHQPDFINAVVALEVIDTAALSPQELLAALFAIESRFGRQRSVPNAARTLDLDLLLYDDTVLDGPQLTLPHPRMHQRAFVLAPLLEVSLAPAGIGIDIPGHGAASALLAACADQAIEKLADRI